MPCHVAVQSHEAMKSNYSAHDMGVDCTCTCVQYDCPHKDIIVRCLNTAPGMAVAEVLVLLQRLDFFKLGTGGWLIHEQMCHIAISTQ